MKKALSIILAITMLLGCSLSAFALEMKEPCEESGCTGEIVALRESEEFEESGGSLCPDCNSEQYIREVFFDEYRCDTCDTLAYRVFRYYKTTCYGVQCSGADSSVPCVRFYYDVDEYGWQP